MKYSFDTISFFIGIILATLIWWIFYLSKPVVDQLVESLHKRSLHRTTKNEQEIEKAYLKAVYKQTQGLHLAASLFSLDEIIEPARLLAPPVIQASHYTHHHRDIVEEVVPYLINSPELGAFYKAHTLTLSQAISGGMHLAIIGKPGSGKTTSIVHLASQISNSSLETKEVANFLPFLVHVADLVLPVKKPEKPDGLLTPIIESLTQIMGIFEGSRFSRFVKNTFSDGRALLLLDGVDEFPQPYIQEISAYLQEILSHYPKTRVIITGAPEYLDGILSLGFTPLSIMPWDNEQQTHFLRNWSDLWQKNNREDPGTKQPGSQVDQVLLDRWISSNNFGLTPLELTLKVWGVYAGDAASSNLSDSIKAHICRLTPANVSMESLSFIALQVVKNETPFFDPRLAREWARSPEIIDTAQALEEADQDVEKESSKAETSNSDLVVSPLNEKETKPENQPGILNLISSLLNSGILTSHVGSRVSFSHPVFLGYLGGMGLGAHPNLSSVILSQTAWSAQTTTIKYMASFTDMSEVVNYLLALPDPILMRPRLAAGRLLHTPMRPNEVLWRSSVIASLIDILQNNDNPISLRAEAMVILALSNEANIDRIFRLMLATNSPENQRLAALGAGLVKDQAATEHLLGIIPNSNESVRQAVCLSLVAIGTPHALEAVALCLLRGDEHLRVYAAEALANHPGDGREALREGSTSQDILVRRAIVYGLARLPDKWASELLENIQMNDEQWAVRNVAVEFLRARQVADPHIPSQLLPPHETPWLIEVASKYGMGIGPGQSATDILLLSLKEPGKEYFQPALAYLRNTPTEGVLSALYPFLYGSDLEAREGVYQALLFM